MRTRLTNWAAPAVALTAAVILVTAACGSTSSPTTASVAGTYALQTIDGKNLPYLVGAQSGDSSFVTSGRAVLTTSSYIFQAVLRNVIAGMSSIDTLADTGTYTLSGTAIGFKSNSDSSTTPATVNGNVITVTGIELGSTSVTLVFSK